VLSALATIHGEVGSLDRVRRVVSVLGVVNATPEFTQHTQVSTARRTCSSPCGDGAAGTRAWAVGVSSLPANLALEVTMTVELSPCRTART
jgi:hypothetical protein